MRVAVVEVVDRVLPMAAGDDGGRRTELVQPRGEHAARGVEARECLRLEQIRRHHGRERKEVPDQRFDGVVLEQLGAGARDHHRIDDERHCPALQIAGDRFDQRAREEHPGLRGVDSDVAEDGIELRDDEGRWQLVDRADLDGALRGERDDRPRCRGRPPPRTPSDRPGCRRRRPSRTSRS